MKSTCADDFGSRALAIRLFVLLLTTFAVAPLVHAADAERIVVTNARLIGRDAPSNDVRVNLLIVGGKLVVVTKDDLVIEAGRRRCGRQRPVFSWGNWSWARAPAS